MLTSKASQKKGRRRAKPAFQSKSMFAAVDLGTNNCRLLIAEPRGKRFRVVDSYSQIVRLGEGMSASGVLSDDAISRTLSITRRTLPDASRLPSSSGGMTAAEALGG